MSKYVMDDKTREALRGSIYKWVRIVEGTELDRGTQNCPLCQIFLAAKGNCDGCPVEQRTGRSSCNGTPYWEFHDYQSGLERPLRNKRAAALAKAELDFLRSLDV